MGKINGIIIGFDKTLFKKHTQKNLFLVFPCAQKVAEKVMRQIAATKIQHDVNISECDIVTYLSCLFWLTSMLVSTLSPCCLLS